MSSSVGVRLRRARPTTAADQPTGNAEQQDIAVGTTPQRNLGASAEAARAATTVTLRRYTAPGGPAEGAGP
jgi:hypothetical protein